MMLGISFSQQLYSQGTVVGSVGGPNLSNMTCIDEVEKSVCDPILAKQSFIKYICTREERRYEKVQLQDEKEVQSNNEGEFERVLKT
jgi:hypothetical protein